MNVRFVTVDPHKSAEMVRAGAVTREDVDIFLAARAGEVDCFVSANRELVRTAAAQTNAFACLLPEEFFAEYLV
jgi:hypothetical protein